MMNLSSLLSHESPTSPTPNWRRNSMTSDSDRLDMSGNVTLKRDRKAHDCWLITTTDREGFHRQLAITYDDMTELVRLWIDEVI
jgi:hypothetical protein